MSTAHAVWFTAPRTAEVRSEPVGRPGPGQVLVEGLWSLVSAGTEMLLYRGETDPAWDLGHPLAEGSFDFPVKYAYQTVGRILEAGPGSPYAAGDIVFARHPHQTLFVMPDDPTWLIRVPYSDRPERATFTNLVDVALNCLLDVPVRLGDVVVVYGQGVVGSLCAQLARRTAGVVVAVDPVLSRREFARAHGADAAVVPAEARDAVLDLSGGRGADVVIEASGAPAALQSAIELLGREGTIGVVSMYGTRTVTLRLTPEFHYGGTRIVSSQAGHVPAGLSARWDMARRFRVAAGLVAELDVEAMVTHRFALDDAPAAYELVDRHPDTAMGVLLHHPAAKEGRA